MTDDCYFFLLFRGWKSIPVSSLKNFHPFRYRKVDRTFPKVPLLTALLPELSLLFISLIPFLDSSLLKINLSNKSNVVPYIRSFAFPSNHSIRLFQYYFQGIEILIAIFPRFY